MYKLSQNSLNKLYGVHPALVKVVKRAIEITKVDFLVFEGVRTLDRQTQLFKAGKSKTMKSNHLTGNAIDLYPLKNGKTNWKPDWSDKQNDWYLVATAMFQAAQEQNVKIRWGATWGNLNDKLSTFLDAPHFELV